MLILASTSRYRRELLTRLRVPFECIAPEVDEALRVGELPQSRALRLAHAKAEAVATAYPNAVVIGSDQVAAMGDAVLRKPGSVTRACAQLAQLSGHQADFHTAVVVKAPASQTQAHCDHTWVQFRKLDVESIERYVAAEQPIDCAGAFKCEGLGIALFVAIHNQDPTALIGLPLIALASMLRELGFSVP